VVDLKWKPIPQTDLYELQIELGFGIATGVRIVFFGFSSPATQQRCLWVLGGMEQIEKLDLLKTSIYVGRSIIIKERATELGEENDTQT
jgi:hypothetical protein